MGEGLFTRVTEVGADVYEVLRWPAAAVLLWFMHRLTRRIYRDDMDAMKRLNETLTAENDRLNAAYVRLNAAYTAMEERKDYYKSLAHERGNTIMRAEVYLFDLALELGREPPDLNVPEKEA